MKIEKVKIELVKSNPNNPRLIKDDKFKKLVKSIKDFPEMLEVRPIVVDETMIVLGGNMRLRACKEAGLEEVYIIKLTDLTEEQKGEFVIKDNASFGDWDWEVLQSTWDMGLVSDWGIDVFELPNELDYSMLDDDDDDNDDANKKVKEKADGNSKSVLLPFRKPEDMAAFTKMMKQWQNDGLCPGHTALEAVKKYNDK